MPAISGDIASILKEEIAVLTGEISAYLFNEPLEQDPLTDQLNKLSGVCRLLELDSAVVLVEELKKTIYFIIDKGRSPVNYQPELTAILEVFPHYFQVFHQLQTASPFLFTPELAVLRRVQGLPPLYEFQILKHHHWPPGEQFQGLTELTDSSRAALKKLKPVFQMGLLEILRGRDVTKGADTLSKVASRLKMLFTTEAEKNYWQLVEYVACGFRDQKLTFNAVRMRLVAAVERQIKTLLDGVGQSSKAYPLGLWRAYGILLSLIPDKSPEQSALCQWVGAPEFGFSDAALSEARAIIFGEEDDSLDTMIAELATRLGTLHNILEIVDSQSQLSAEEGEEFGALVSDIASLCRDNGLLKAAERFEDHHSYIRAASGEDWQPSSGLLKDTAHSLLYVECLLLNLREQGVALKGLVSKLDLRDVNDVVEDKLVATSIHAVWEECLNKLSATKDTLDDVVSELAGEEVAESLVRDFREIEGAAKLVGEIQVVEIVSRCKQFVSDRLFALGAEERNNSMAYFADAVVALEYFFQNSNKGEKSDFVLAIAEDYLTAMEAA
jgi:scaffold protein FimL